MTDAIGAARESAPTTEMPAAPAGEGSAPTTELVAGAVADRCANCQAPLAPDQRYCVNCGERRGRARFSDASLAAQTAPAAVEAPVHASRRYPRMSSASTLITGVATLLIALGVGVLIGHYSNNATPARAPANQIITLGGAGSANTGAATGASNPTGSANTGKKVKAKATVVHVTAKTAKAATAAASKVLGSTANKNLSKNVTQQVGGSCTGGAGCQNGKFTGNFFPSG